MDSRVMAFSRQKAISVTLHLRAALLDAMRYFFNSQGYLEVETPIRIPAPAPEAHIDAQPSGPWYLHTSPELCMKRLLAAGFPKIYQICKCFRQGERGRRHLPEMTMLEWYAAGCDYRHLMAQCEALIPHVAHALGLPSRITYQGRTIDLSPPWERLSVDKAFRRHWDCSATRALEEGRFDEVMGLQIEPELGWERPVFLCDYPAACAALARLKPDQPEVAERFELYIGGLELCNGFSELTDPGEQRRRFGAEIERRRAAGKAVYPLPEPFLDALGQMPAAAGNALGIDRLVMLLTDSDHIDPVVAFTPEEL
ncbi:MAG: EF-P lysine aminoacylase EpmA [Desulfatitalea sp.]